MPLTGKVALVTGAGRGIGKAIAMKLANLGADIVINDIAASDSIDATAGELRNIGRKVEAVKGDIRIAADVEALFCKAMEVFGRLDILVNNAGITRDTLIIRMSDKDWDDVLDVNLKGAFFCTRAASKIMMKQRSGRIVNISSVSGVKGNAGQANYSASKAGLIGLTKSTAKELAPRGITCNAVAPGFIQSKMTETLPDKIKESYLSSIPLGRFGTPDDVADAVVFLSGDASKYITGQVIYIDGGMVM